MKQLIDKDQRNATTTGTCKVPAPKPVPTIAYQPRWGTVPYAPDLWKATPCTYVPEPKSIKTRHEAVYIEQFRNHKAVRIPFEVVDHTIRNQGSSLKRSMRITSENRNVFEVGNPIIRN